MRELTNDDLEHVAAGKVVPGLFGGAAAVSGGGAVASAGGVTVFGRRAAAVGNAVAVAG